LKDRENSEIDRQPTEIEGMKSLKAQLTNLAGFGGTQKGPQIASKRGAGI